MKKFLLISSLLLFVYSLSIGQKRFLSFENGETSDTNISSEAVRNVSDLISNGVEVSYDFSGAIITDRIVDETRFNFIHIDDFSKMSRVGGPALPIHTDIIALPKGAKPVLTIISSEYYEYSGFYIHPALKPANGVAGDPGPEFEIDSVLYSKNEYYPKNIADITNIQHSRGTPLAYVSLYPVQFNPVTKTIRVYTNITYKIEYEGRTKSFNDISQTNTIHYTNMLKSNVLNYKSIPDGKKENEINNKGVEKNYIIITHSEYIDAANNLANWKRQLGYSVEVVSQSSWTTTQIKSAISDRYNAWSVKPDYFVIIGDHDGSYAMPGEIYNPPSASDDFATDLYYACMDGGSDYVPDMAHGRISVRSESEANIVVNKIINYEMNPPTDANFYSTAAHCAQFQVLNNDYAERRFCQTAEECLEYVTGLPNGYTVNRVYAIDGSTSGDPHYYNDDYYSAGEVIPSYLWSSNGFTWDGDKNDIAAEINDGRFYLLHRDHGYTGGVGWYTPEFLTTDIPAMLSNGDELPVVFSMNCHTGEFQLTNCFAEQFIRLEGGGAVGVVAAAYYSISGYNDALTIGMFDAIWPGFEPNFTGSGHTGTPPYPTYPEIFTMGDVLNQGLLRMTQSWGDAWGYEEYEYQLFHWFGDPAMKIWTSNPHSNTITASHPASVDCAGTTFAITGSEPDATATLVFNDELIGEVVLDGSGNGTINYAILTPGSVVTLTISKTNCLVYTVDLPLSGSCNFPPAVITNAATLITGSSATLNGEISDDFGETVTESGFVYSTSTDPLIGGPGVIQVQTSPIVTSGAYNEAISGLSSATTYYFKAYAINANGTGYGDEENFTTDCGTFTLPFTEDFSDGTLPLCWENIDNQGNGQIWEFDNPGGISVNSTTNGNGFAILDSDNYGSGNTQNADLITPTLNLSGYTGVNLYFEHYYRDYQSESATLSYSIDGGNNWTDIQSWSSSTANIVTFDQAVPAVDGEANVKFKWNYTGTWGYYWAIDDINITGTVTGTPPSVTTQAVTDISCTTATGNGNITDLGTPNPSAHGVCWNTSGTPTISDSYTDEGTASGTGAFTSSMTGLAIGTTYYVRAFATNTAGTVYGTEVSFTTDPGPTAPTSVTATETEICDGDNTTLSYTGGSGTTFNWYTGSCGGTLVGTGNNFSVSPSATTTYYGGWETTCGLSSCQSVTITVNTVPAAAGTISGTTDVCMGDNGVAYSVAAISGATNYIWNYTGSDYTINGSTESITIDFGPAATSGILTVYGTNACGNGTVSADYDITVTDCSAGYTISGQVRYDNGTHPAIGSQTVELYNSSSVLVATTTTDASGNYSFSGVSDGDYTVVPVIGAPFTWGGTTSMDVTIFKQEIGDPATLSGVREIAGCVIDGNPPVSAADMTQILRRIVAMTYTFVGDWAYSDGSVTVSGADATVDIQTVCFGDANASKTVAKDLERLFANNSTTVYVDENEYFEIPVVITSSVNDLASVTAEINYDPNLIEISDITMARNNYEMLYNIDNGLIRLAYSTLDPADYNNDELLTIKGYARGINKDLNIFDDAYGEFGDIFGSTVTGITFDLPLLSPKGTGMSKINSYIFIYPNPAHNYINISNIKDTNIEIIDLLGNVIMTKKAANYTERIHTDQLSAGTYFIRIYKNNTVINKMFTITK